jgi:hypothetical protein
MKAPVDDRGEPCRIAQLSATQIGWRSLGLKSVTKDAVTKGEQAITEGRETGVALFGGFVGYLLWQVAISPYSKPALGSLVDILLQVVFAIVVAMVFWYLLLGWVRRGRFEKIAEIYLAQGRCASCGYELSGLEKEDDGCVICPECHAAWKESRVGQPANDEAES